MDWVKSSGIADVVGSTSCTRVDAVTYLRKLAGSPQVTSDTSFIDVTDGTERAKAISWAVSKGITNGTDVTHFSPANLCTRGQIVTFLYRAYAE